MPVFISHHSSKNEIAAHVAAYLERHHIACWYAPRNVPAGGAWDEAIANAITEASALVLLFCARADASRHVKREIAIADETRTPIFWVRLEQIEPHNLGYFLSTNQWIDWLDQRDATLDQLITALRRPAAPSQLQEEPMPSAVTAEPVPLTGWPRAIAAFENENAAAEATAHAIFRTARSHPYTSVVLPTGRTATTLFRGMLVVAPSYEPAPFGDTMVVSDTETFGVYEGHHTSRSRHVRTNLLDRLAAKDLAPPPDQIHLLSGLVMEADPFLKTQRLLRDYPPSIHAVAISPTGELLGYEVATYTDADEIANDGCHVIEVSEPGRRYIDPDQPSKSVVTIGLGAALAARISLVLALDPSKARIVSQVVRNEETAGIPASLLRRHASLGIVTTRAVARDADLAQVENFDDAEEGAAWLISTLG